MIRCLPGLSKISVVISLLVIPKMALACPECKRTLAENNLDVAFAISILFMMSVPFLILAGWGAAIYRMRMQWSEANSGANSSSSSLPSSLT